jgi:hypothetical protein
VLVAAFYFKFLPPTSDQEGRQKKEKTTMQNNNTIIKAGETVVKETKRGIEFHAFNFQRQRMLHIGTLSGQVYEKVAVILRQPEPSFALTQTEFGAVQETGAGFIRIVTPDKDATYAISVGDFQRHAEAYYNAAYGPQWRVPLGKFSHVATAARRNAHIDNPVIETKHTKPEAVQVALPW